MKTYKDQFMNQLKKVAPECEFDDSDGKSIHTLGEEWSEEDESNKLVRLESVWRGEVLSLLDEAGLGDTETVWSVIKRSVELGEIIEQRKTVFNRDNAKTGKPMKEAQFSSKPKKLAPWKVYVIKLRKSKPNLTPQEIMDNLIQEGFATENRGLYKITGDEKFVQIDSFRRRIDRIPSIQKKKTDS